MPNWVHNILNIKGKNTNEFMDYIRENSNENLIDFNLWVPYPEGLVWSTLTSKEDHEKNYPDLSREEYDRIKNPGYHWCCNNWGTKWPAVDTDLTLESKEHIRFFFDTANSPPIPIIRAMGSKFPNLTFELNFQEILMCLKGRYEIKGEEEIYERDEEWDPLAESYEQRVGKMEEK